MSSSLNFSLSFRDLTDNFIKDPVNNRNLLEDIRKHLSKLQILLATDNDARKDEDEEKLDADLLFISLSKLYPISELNLQIIRILNSARMKPFFKYYSTLFPQHPFSKSLLFPFGISISETNNEIDEGKLDPETILSMGHLVTRRQATSAIKRCKNYPLLKAYFSSQFRFPPLQSKNFTNSDKGEIKSPINDNRDKSTNGSLEASSQLNKKAKTENKSVAAVNTVKDSNQHPPDISNSDTDLINSIIFEK